MSVQVLVTTMNLDNPELFLRSLNIRSSFVVGNQSNKNRTEEYVYFGYKGLIVSRNEKGVGKNRNITLKYSDADICILSDDDVRFLNDYVETVNREFERLPDADVLIFNLENAGDKRRTNTRIKKINRFNYMNYGAARVAFRRKAISYHGIFFNTNFGGGTFHSAGEDSLFLLECIEKDLNIFAVPVSIATLMDNRRSTWFSGYNCKYLFDKGVYLGIAHPKLAKIIALYLSIKHPEYGKEGLGFWDVLKEMCKGIDYIVKRVYLHNEI